MDKRNPAHFASLFSIASAAAAASASESPSNPPMPLRASLKHFRSLVISDLITCPTFIGRGGSIHGCNIGSSSGRTRTTGVEFTGGHRQIEKDEEEEHA